VGYFSSFLAAGFLAGAFLVLATSASILSSSASTFLAGAFFSTFFGVHLGASCKAFNDKPILFLLGSKLIIFAVSSSPTLI